MGLKLPDLPIIRTHGRPLCFAVGLLMFSLGGLNVYREHSEHPGQRVRHFFAAVPGRPASETAGGDLYLPISMEEHIANFSPDYNRIPFELLAAFEPSVPRPESRQPSAEAGKQVATLSSGSEPTREPQAVSSQNKADESSGAGKAGDDVVQASKQSAENADGSYYKIQPGESLWEISRRYRIGMNTLIAFNNIRDPAKIRAGQELFIPGVNDLSKGPDFIWPVRGRLTSRFGYRQHPMGGGRKFHRGIDIAAPVGQSVLAARAGTVTYASRRGALGLTVIIDHGESYQTIYGHNSKILVKVGQKIQQGHQIAEVGSTGLSTGPHVHFEIRKGGRAIDPLPYLP